MTRARSLRRGSGLPGGQSRIPLILAATLALTACAATQSDAAVTQAADTPGFLLGLWHGFIFPVAWVVSLFMDKVAIYAVPNNGGWYDFGYFLGLVVFGVGARKSHTVTRDRIVHVPIKDVSPARNSQE